MRARDVTASKHCRQGHFYTYTHTHTHTHSHTHTHTQKCTLCIKGPDGRSTPARLHTALMWPRTPGLRKVTACLRSNIHTHKHTHTHTHTHLCMHNSHTWTHNMQRSNSSWCPVDQWSGLCCCSCGRVLCFRPIKSCESYEWCNDE